MNKKYRPDRTSEDEEILYFLIEECSEVIQAATKCLRFGLGGTNPETGDPETNIEAVKREIVDAQYAMDLTEHSL